MYVEKVYGDKAYDNRRNFNILGDIDAEPAISIRKNASTRSKGCPLRRDEVLLIKKVGQAHAEYFNQIRPATTLVEVSRLINPEILVEIEADAIVSQTPK